ncbi:hypothetical protein ACJ41O_008106 [Fusarium nematophilum]
MASRIFGRIFRGKLVASGAAVGGTGIATTFYLQQGHSVDIAAAKVQFHTSSIHPCPPGYTPWEIRNDYPTSEILKSRTKSSDAAAGFPTPPAPGLPGDYEGKDAPWLKIDFRKDPEKYAETIRLYCFDGMVDAGFKPQENLVRNWYHAPWMHYRAPDTTQGYEREPINGLTFERATPAGEFAASQTDALQNWACGFYNETGATVFGDMWKDPANPDFEDNKHFPEGTAVFKILLNDAKPGQLPNMVGSPAMHAVISQSTKNGLKRNDTASALHLIQVDFAVVDDRAPIGWVFGTFMFDGLRKWDASVQPWDKLTLVGITWGNDPLLNQAVYDKDPSEPPKPRECYITPRAEEVRTSLKGKRPFWGWNGRMNGPADNFISACASCHSTATRNPMVHGSTKYGILPPTKWDYDTGKPAKGFDDATVMNWFRNVPPGVPFDEGLDPSDPTVYDPGNPKLASKTKSADYSLQLQVGFSNYKKWVEETQPAMVRFFIKTKYVVGLDKTNPADLSQREQLRQE